MDISLEKISFYYNDQGHSQNIFKDFSLKIPKGEFLMILGPSGCGKTTLLNIVGGLLAPSEGRVLFENSSYYSLSKRNREKFRRKNIGYVFQNFYLIEDISPMDNVLISLSNGNTVDNRLKVKNILKQLGIGEKVNDKISSFSGGERQRLAIARAIVQDSNVLICDEPTGNLDEENAIQIMEILSEINDTGKTIIMVTHNRDLCAYASRVIELTKEIRTGGVEQ